MDDPRLYSFKQLFKNPFTRMSLWSNALNGFDEDRDLSLVSFNWLTESGWKPLTIFPKSSVLDVWQVPEYTSEIIYEMILVLEGKQTAKSIQVRTKGKSSVKFFYMRHQRRNVLLNNKGRNVLSLPKTWFFNHQRFEKTKLPWDNRNQHTFIMDLLWQLFYNGY